MFSKLTQDQLFEIKCNSAILSFARLDPVCLILLYTVLQDYCSLLYCIDFSREKMDLYWYRSFHHLSGLFSVSNA